MESEAREHVESKDFVRVVDSMERRSTQSNASSIIISSPREKQEQNRD